MTAFFKLFNTGTSEGAKAGWEKRKHGEWVAHPTTGKRGVIDHIYEDGSGGPSEKGRLVQVDYGHGKANHREGDLNLSADQSSRWVDKPKEKTEADLNAEALARIRSGESGRRMARSKRLQASYDRRGFENSQPCGDSHIPDGATCHVGQGEQQPIHRDAAEERHIAKTVLEQIKSGDKWALAAWGAKNAVAMAAGKTDDGGYRLGGVTFAVNTPKLSHGKVRVSLMANDTYTVESGRVRQGQWKSLGKKEDIYFDQLTETIDSLIEHPKHSNSYRIAIQAIQNAKCGASWISDDKVCRIGQASSDAEGKMLEVNKEAAATDLAKLTDDEFNALKARRDEAFKAVVSEADTVRGVSDAARRQYPKAVEWLTRLEKSGGDKSNPEFAAKLAAARHDVERLQAGGKMRTEPFVGSQVRRSIDGVERWIRPIELEDEVRRGIKAGRSREETMKRIAAQFAEEDRDFEREIRREKGD